MFKTKGFYADSALITGVTLGTRGAKQGDIDGVAESIRYPNQTRRAKADANRKRPNGQQNPPHRDRWGEIDTAQTYITD